MTRGLRINVALMPPPDVARALAQTAASVGGEQRRFVVGEGQRIPHLTLYMGLAAHTESLEMVAKGLQRTRLRAPRQELRAVAYSLTANGYVEVAYEKSEELISLQREVCRACATHMMRGLAPDTHLSETERLNLASFGYEFIGDQFRPHITLAKFSSNAPIMLPPLDREAASFSPSIIAVSRADTDGCAYELLLSIRLC